MTSTELAREFKLGFEKFQDLPPTSETVEAVQAYVKFYLDKYPKEKDYLLAFMLNDCNDPFEGWF